MLLGSGPVHWMIRATNFGTRANRSLSSCQLKKGKVSVVQNKLWAKSWKLDATQWFFEPYDFAEHVSGIIMPIIRSLRLYRWPQRVTPHLGYGRLLVWSEVHFRPAHDTATDTEWQLLEVVLTQFVSPDDEHDVLETCRVKNKSKNKYIVKNCASRWSFTKNHNMMHGEQNVKWTGVLKVRLGGAVGLAKGTFVICYSLSLW